MKPVVAHITTCRSDYGPAFWFIKDLLDDDRFDGRLIVGGSHLSSRHGATISEIERDGLRISQTVPFLGEPTSPLTTGEICAKALHDYSRVFASMRPDLVVLYGDRYELLPIATAALMQGCALAHICGGDLTEGAIDDQVRHALTKLAHLHFPSTISSFHRVLQMGEEPWRVVRSGDPALDHFYRSTYAQVGELRALLGFHPDKATLLVTFHPVTLELQHLRSQVRALKQALRRHLGSLIITAPAPDPGQEVIREELASLNKEHPHCSMVESLGSHNYRGLLRLVGAVVGNSSSGLIESAAIPLPAVNIGNRQRGRDRAANVIDCEPNEDAIGAAIDRALSTTFDSQLSTITNPYGDGTASRQIIQALYSQLKRRGHLMPKRFIDYRQPIAPSIPNENQTPREFQSAH